MHYQRFSRKWDTTLVRRSTRAFLQDVPPVPTLRARCYPCYHMPRKPTKSGNIYLPPGSDPPPDENVKLPPQVKHAAAVANARATGQPVPPKPKLQARPGFPHTDTEIDDALQRLRQGTMQLSDPEFKVIHDLAEEGAQHIKSRRVGGGQPRTSSDEVKRRLKALLHGYQQLSPRLQKTPTGASTVGKLRDFVVKELNLPDDVVSEETIRHDIRQVRPLMRLILEGKIPVSFFGNS
jgi:hypothetical protein